MRLIPTLLLLIVLSACASPTATPPPMSPTAIPPTPTELASLPLTGTWLGGVTKPDGTIASLSLNFDTAQLSIEPLTKTWPIAPTSNGEGFSLSVSSKVKDPFTQISLTGIYKNNGLSAEVDWDGQKSEVTFTQIVTVDPTLLAVYEGVYRFDSGRALSIIVSPQYDAGGLSYFSRTLMLTDFDSGALRALYPVNDSTFMVGALRVVGAPFAGRLQFSQDEHGNVTGLDWWNDVNAVNGQHAERLQYTSEDVTFTSADGTKLAGRLSLPSFTSPIPAFMMLHGSEQGTKDNFGNKVMAHFMVSQGIAILNYDKRGVGDSEGVYVEAASEGNLKKHAEDAVAGANYLASRPEIDAQRIALIGGSQAGWVIPLAAAQSADISSFVIISGPVTSTHQEDVFSSYTNDGESVTQYDDAEITQRLRGLKPGGFDPIPILAELEQPGLWLWGSVDKNQPVTFDAENLQALMNAGRDNFSYIIFPYGDHNLNETPNGLFAEMPYSPRVLFYSSLADWIKTTMHEE